MTARLVSRRLTVTALAVMARLTQALMLVLVAAVLVGCGDEPDWIVIDGQRYVGAEIPLQVDEGSASTIGLVTEANHQGRLGLELVALSGVDQRQVVLARRTAPEPELELGPFIVYRAESLGDGNLFRLVPALCAFSAPRDECARVGGLCHQGQVG